jgi:hypothetical protein
MRLRRAFRRRAHAFSQATEVPKNQGFPAWLRMLFEMHSTSFAFVSIVGIKRAEL